MKNLNRKLPQVDPSRFAMVPRNDVPRSTFATSHTVKNAFDVDYLIPIHLDEVLPGDVHDGEVTIFARLNNLIFPLMDNMTVETFFFFVPNRLLWDNWQKFCGEQKNPGDSIDYTIPTLPSPAGGFTVGGLADAFGLPTVGQVAPGNIFSVNALPFRAYNLIFNEWFRDENLMNSLPVPTGDGPDTINDYNREKRCKKHDYFTSCLPWPQKGATGVSLPIGGIATIRTQSTPIITSGSGNPILYGRTTNSALITPPASGSVNVLGQDNLDPAGMMGGLRVANSATLTDGGFNAYPVNLYADLSTATGATINAQRLAVATQQFLEKDARGGTRYTELLRNHFGVTPEDARLQRPEYIGGGRSYVKTQAMPQTSEGTATAPLGRLAGQSIVADQHRFKYHATEHGWILGLINVTGDVTYQQGLHKMWWRRTRYDMYWPTFANLGEQAVLLKELYCQGGGADDTVFGYQERWAEYRYLPSRISGLFKSTAAGNIDEWHLSQQFTTLPTLNATFIRQATPLSRALAAGTQADNQQILFDSVFNLKRTRPMPMYSVPGLTRF